MTIPRLVIAGTGSNVGKTTVTLALLAALRARGRRVQPFKVGPDYIDPGHHAAATGRPSHNLDGWMLAAAVNRQIFGRAAAGADIAVLEGMMGLFDASTATGDAGSTAEMAKQIGAPVLLVVDGSGMARSAAAMVGGYARFDPTVTVAGVLFNRVGSRGHFCLLKEAVEAALGIAVVGYLRPDAALTIGDRHLGLRTAIEQGATDLYEKLGRAAAETIDLDQVEALARSAGEFHLGATAPSLALSRERGREGMRVRIGLAYDPAFCFYYPDNLALLEAEDAELIWFSPLRDRALPEVDLLYLGGGYPELYGEQLAANHTMRQAIKAFAAQGGPIFAECGGMMYLTQAIRDFDGQVHDMVGLFAAEARMRKPGLTLGYREIETTRPGPLGPAGTKIRGHEFHYSTLVPQGHLDYACVVTDATGAARPPDGLVMKNVLALYAHVHFSSRPEAARSLVAAARNWRRTGRAEVAP